MSRRDRQTYKAGVSGDAGFSLLELIVSVAILAIIIAPLLTAFVVSSGSVSKSKRTADQNAAAQTVYEKIKDKPGDYFFKWARGENKKNTDPNAVSDDDKRKGYEKLLSYFGTVPDTAIENSVINTGWTGSNKKKNDNHGDIVYLAIPNIYQNGTTKYSAAVTIQAGLGNDSALTGNIADLVKGTSISDMNEKLRTQPMSFDNIFVQPTDPSIDPDKLAFSTISSKDTIIKRKRSIYVHFTTDVSGPDGDKETYVKPVVAYCYDITYIHEKHMIRLYAYPTYDSTTRTISVTSKKTVDGAITSLAAGEEAGFLDDSFSSIKYKYMKDGKQVTAPINFFVCYQPFYLSMEKTYKEDVIIDNLDGVKGDVYIVKQNGNETSTYGGRVRLLENHVDTTEPDLLVHTNMGLKNDLETALPGRYEFRKFYDIDESKLQSFFSRLSGTSSSMDPVVDVWYVDGSDDDSFKHLISQKAEEHLYSVTIRIYDSLQLAAAGGSYGFSNGYYTASGSNIEPRYTLTGIKRG